MHAIDGGDGWELLLEVFDAMRGATLLQVRDDGGELLRVAVDFWCLRGRLVSVSTAGGRIYHVDSETT